MTPLENRQGTWAKILSGVLAAINIILGIWAYPHLGDRVPSHWNFAGEINGYTSRFNGAFTIPLVILGIYLLFWLIPRIDPKKANYSQMTRIYWITGFVIIFFLSLMYMGSLAVALGYLKNLPRWYFSGIGLLFVVLGNYFGKIKFNYFFGIRTSWTLANEEVWYRTHRFAGPIWMIGGILLAILGFLPAQWVGPLVPVIIIVMAGIPIIYSYWLYQKLSH